MTTQLIGLKEFRQNLSHYTKEAKSKNKRFIVLKKNRPVLDVRALDEKQFALENLAAEIIKSREQAKKGRVYTQEQILKEFGLL